MDETYKEEKRRTRLSVWEKYDVLGKIGSGTYGVVYKARSRNKDDPKEYAIKKFKSTPETDGLSQSACREITLCRELCHENIVALEEVLLDPADRSIYMVFDYAEYDLLQILQYHRDKKKPMSEETVKSILWQILNGVCYLHANWVLHRDLKPANILVMGEGLEKGTVKIADLGLARLFQTPLQPLTVADKVVVTIWYRAPELLLGAKHYTKAVDVWAVGCIFAELLTLRPLFKGNEEKPDKNNRNPFQRDQLDKILQVLGFPDKEKWSSMDNLPEAAYLQTFKGNYKYQLYNHIARNVYDPNLKFDGAYKLLARMLEYDPAKRITADEALNHPYFMEDPKPIMNSLYNSADDVVDYPKRAVVADEKELVREGLGTGSSQTKRAKTDP